MIAISGDELEGLNKTIEELSDELRELIKDYAITDREVIEKSREIDGLITRYHEILREM